MAVMLSGCTYYRPVSVAAGDQTDPNIQSYEGSCEYVIGIPIGDKTQCTIARIIKDHNLKKTYSSDSKLFDFFGLFDKTTTMVRGTQ